MAGKIKIRVNERAYEVSAAPDTPLLYVLSNELHFRGRDSAAGWRSAVRVRCWSTARRRVRA